MLGGRKPDATRQWPSCARLGRAKTPVPTRAESHREFKKLSWKQQNQFVHTGHLQRIGRISREDLQSPYPDEGIILQVNITTQALLLVAIFVLKAIGRVPKAERLERFILAFGSTAQS